MTEHTTAVTQMVSDKPSTLYPTVNDDDDEVDQSNGDDTVSSQSESDDDNDPEERELQTLVNHVPENIVPQWKSSQWFSSARNPPKVGIGSLKTYENTLSKIATYGSFLIATKVFFLLFKVNLYGNLHLQLTDFVYATFGQISTRVLRIQP
ncbi:hypothetical protein M9H77_12892 [Catharanthus roseus]|uniref:Uncharacterized protein n=1 Tax=Catharanthus roseus TaxID=4058 RepID=A0ACC0BIT8_CATRO|nr:hypothetical protein M9H77_12892 [Catharanthus roseus]